jgi:hypothetical protein
MLKGYRPYFPELDLLLPPSLRDWLPENHLAYFVGDVVDQLDLAAIYAVYEQELRGQPPYDPHAGGAIGHPQGGAVRAKPPLGVPWRSRNRKFG